MIDGFLGRGFLFYQVFPLLMESSSSRIVIEINASHCVLHHVLHNPVGREYLSGSRNFIGLELAFLGKYLILALGDIELIEPANQFGRMKVFVRDKFGM